jgi:deoxycytidine triphosphate deaminase
LIDLAARITGDEAQFLRAEKSSDSLVLVTPVERTKIDRSRATIDLTVGPTFYPGGRSALEAVPEGGVVLGPRQSAVIVTEQEVQLPLNVFGLVTGKGKRIFDGLFISAGKIDPGYCGPMRIGIFNGSDTKAILPIGMPLCECAFVSMEYHLESANTKQFSPPARPSTPTVYMRLSRWGAGHQTLALWLTVLVGALAVLVAVLK